MQILHLFSKHRPIEGVLPQTRLAFQRGYGIVGDDHARTGSPRQVLLVDQQSINRFGLQPGDLQENLLIDADLTRLTSGQVIQLGPMVLIRLTIPCEPCATLERLRRGLTKQLQGQRGYLGLVLRSGSVTPGDAVLVTEHRFPAIPAPAKARLQDFVARIPPGQVVRTPTLIQALGWAKAYYRALPTLVKTAPRPLPVHRILAADGGMLTKHLPHQAKTLLDEGIAIVEGKVPATFNWPPQEFYDLGSWGV